MNFPLLNRDPRPNRQRLWRASDGVVEAAIAPLARRLPPQVSREDLASAGKVALVTALDRFQGPVEEVRAYAYTRVRGALLDELRRLDPLSRRTRAKADALRVAQRRLENELGRTPTEAELADAAGLPETKVREIERLKTATQTATFGDLEAGEAAPLAEMADPAATNPARVCEEDDAYALVRVAIGKLPPNQAYAVRRTVLEEATLEEVAGELGISKERVRQLREAATKRLRAELATPLGYG